MRHLGHFLKLLRTVAGIPQQQLAHDLGVSANYLSLIEHGYRVPSLTFLRRFADHFHVSLGYFLWIALDAPDLETEAPIPTVMPLQILRSTKKGS